MKPNWLLVSRHWYFPQISEVQESWRTWRRKISQTQRRSDQAQKVGRCCSAALEASGPKWTVKPLVFLISRWRFILLALVFVKFVCRKAVAIAVAFRCCGLYIGRAVKNKTTNGGYRLVWESLNCWMIVQLIRAVVRFVFIHDFVEFVSTEQRRVCLFLQLITARVLYLWTRFFQPGSIYFCLTSLILLKQLFLLPSWPIRPSASWAIDSFGLEE